MPKKKPSPLRIDTDAVNKEVSNNETCSKKVNETVQSFLQSFEALQVHPKHWTYLSDIDFQKGPIGTGKTGSIFAYKNDTEKVIKFSFVSSMNEVMYHVLEDRFGEKKFNRARGAGGKSCTIIEGDKNKWWFNVQNRLAEETGICPRIFEYGLISNGQFVVQEFIPDAMELINITITKEEKENILQGFVSVLQDYGVCHNDLHERNIVYSKSRKKYYVVDFDLATEIGKTKCADGAVSVQVLNKMHLKF